MNRGARPEPPPPESSRAAEIFDHFCSAGTMKQILALHRELCNTLNMKPNRLPEFYPKLKSFLVSSWRAIALFKEFDARASHKIYGKARMCAQSRVLIIGAGPCGLRAAIECQLLGAKVVVVEKRDKLSRNNVLRLWPFVIHDLRALGAKKFFGKFCAGTINHISIRQLQLILLKVSLLLGVEFHEGVGFEELLEPTTTEKQETVGWRARVSPAEHPVSEYEFDTLIGADGRRNALQGFNRKEFRGRLAMGITANFINKHTEREASVDEIGGVAFIFNQKFFKELYEETGINLENIVYYKDDTHYFVMTAKKQSLLDKGVLRNDYADVNRFLSAENMDREALKRYAREAAQFSTKGGLTSYEFALNHYGEPDVALFDFSAMFAAGNASLVREKHNRRLLCLLVGDSLMEPFWPTGSGCARGFLSALDAAWCVRAWSRGVHPQVVIAERESVYRLLAQTTAENIQRDYGAFTLDPGSRYPNLNRNVVSPQHVEYLYISDDRQPLDMTQPSDGGSSNNSTRKRRRGEGQEVDLPESVLLSWVGGASCMSEAIDADCLGAAVRRYRPDLLPAGSEPQVYQVLQQQLGIHPLAATGSTDAKMRNYLSRVYNAFKGEIPYVHHDTSYVYDQIKQSLQKEKTVRHTHDHSPTNYKNAADLDKSHSSSRKKRRSVRTPQQEEGRLVGVGGREFGSGFRVARLAAELAGSAAPAAPKANKPKDLMRSVGKIERDDWHVKEIERKMIENRLGRPEPKSAERVPKWDRTQFLGRKSRITEGDQDKKHGEFYEKIHIIDQKLHDSGRPDHGTKKVASLANKFVTKGEPEPGPNKTPKKETQPKEDRKLWRSPPTSGTMCATCGKRVFAAESVLADGLHLHRTCFRCNVCRAALKPGNYTMERYGTRLVCLRHSGISVPDSVAAMDGAKETRTDAPTPTPERISLEASDSGAREIDEDEWTDRNCLPSETSAAGGLSDEDDSSSDEYTDADSSTDEAQQQSEGEPRAMRPALAHPPRHPSIESFGYDEYEEDGAESSGNESCSRMREAREARRREVPADKRPPTDSSEVETDESSDSSSEEDEMSSGTAVSTDSEFGREESAPPAPPAILVTEAPPPAPPPLPRVAPAPPADFPLSRTKSAGGLATKRALELKRKYLLGEPSPPSVRKSDSTSQLDTKLEAFRTNITEFQKMLHPAPQPPPTRPVVAFQLTTPTAKKPMPDIIKNLCEDAPVDLLTKVEPIIDDWVEETAKEKNDKEELDSDSLSESSHTETAPNQAVPRLEVHDEIGELIQLDSLMIVNSSSEDKDDRATNTATVSTEVTVIVAESESSESCRDVTTLALTETELSDWAAESGVLEDCALDDRQENSRSYNPRGLSGPKTVHDAKNISAITSHVCGRTSPDQIVYSNALEHFEFADEGEQDPSVEFPVITRNFGYMEFVEDEYDPYTVSNDRSMNFIERSFSEIIVLPNQDAEISLASNTDDRTIQNEDIMIKSTDSEPTVTLEPPNGVDLKSPQLLLNIENVNIETLSPEQSTPVIALDNGSFNLSNTDVKYDTTVSSPSLIDSDVSKCDGPKATPTQSNSTSEDSPPLAELSISKSFSNTPIAIPSPYKLYSPAICRSASENFNRSLSRSTESPTQSFDLSVSLNMSSGSISPTSPVQRDTTDKVQEIKRERDEQTETVRRLVLERIGSGPRVARKCSRRVRASPMSCVPPPVPPPPVMPDPPPPPPPPVEFPSPPPRPAPPLPVTPSFSDPELARERRRKSIIRSLSNYLNRRLGPRTKHEESGRSGRMSRLAHQSTGALERAPPVPPLPVSYRPPQCSGVSAGGASEAEDRDAMQLWFEARWARLVAQRRAREEPRVLRLASLQRRLARPLSAEQEAATVAELVQVSAQREAHQALMAADRRRAASGGVGD